VRGEGRGERGEGELNLSHTADREFVDRAPALWRALRPPQWVKNLLVFVPVALDHRFRDAPVLWKAALAFVAFCLAASGGYVLNDVRDREADRHHPIKRDRPFASGALSPALGWFLGPLLYAASASLAAWTLPERFLALLLCYLIITSAYTAYVKRLAMLDVIVLAGLYTLRVLAGIAATGVRFSTWLLAFSMFLFLSLAFMKRYSELRRYQGRGGRGERRESEDWLAGRGYHTDDREWLASMGGTSGYLSVLVLALYINSEQVTVLYRRPAVLWLVCPLLLYWVSRMWLRAHRGQIDEDPILATVHDPVSYAVGALVVAVVGISI
jgi:4-hydroxybenzoate polyprenyltransferase